MLLRKLCWGLLGFAPLVASADVEECLSGRLIDSLPPNLQETVRKIKRLLENHPSLHLDQPQTWGPDELTLFTDHYFPKLKHLAVAMLSEPTFYRGRFSTAAQSWAGDLKDALRHLLAGCSKEENNPSAAGSVSLVSLAAAKWNCVDLYEIISSREASMEFEEFTPQQWEAVAATFEHQVEIQLMTRFVGELVRAFEGQHDASPLSKSFMEPSGNSNFFELERLVDGLTERLESPFSGLRLAIKDAIATGCPYVSYLRYSLPWDGLFYGGKLVSSNVEGSRALEGFRAKLLQETILLKMELTKLIIGGIRLGSSQEEVSTNLVELEGQIRPLVEKISTEVQGLDGQQTLDGAGLMAAVTDQLTFLKTEGWDKMSMLLQSIAIRVKQLQNQMGDESTLEPETQESLRKVYEVAKQLVESYETVLRLGKELLAEGVERSQFLLTLFITNLAKEKLVWAKGIMDQVEKIFDGRHLELGVEPYDWDRFTLRLWYSRPQVKSAKQSALVKRGRSPPGDDDDEPGAKHAKRESDGSDKDE